MSAPRPLRPGPPQRVLVVDDNLDAAETLAMLLQLDGHHTQVCHDASSALLQVETFAPSVVMIDIGLPGTSGRKLAARIRELPGGRQLRLLAVSGFPDDDGASLRAGFDRHLTKPVDLHLLQQAVWA